LPRCKSLLGTYPPLTFAVESVITTYLRRNHYLRFTTLFLNFLELGDIIGRGVASSIHYLSVAVAGRWYFFGLSFFHSNVSSRHVFAGGGRQDVAIKSHRQSAVDAIFSAFD